MGTNYYIHAGICPCCKHPTDSWHLGKSGRTLQYLDDWEGPYGNFANSMEQWEAIIRDERSTVVDEYGEVIDKEWIINHFKKNSTRELLPEERKYGKFIIDTGGNVLLKGSFS